MSKSITSAVISQSPIQKASVRLRREAPGVVPDPARRHRLGPGDGQAPDATRKPRHHAELPAQSRVSGDHAGEFSRRRVRLRGGPQDAQTRGRAAEQTQPACNARLNASARSATGIFPITRQAVSANFLDGVDFH